MRDEKCEYCRAKCEIDQISGEPVGSLLNGRTGMFCFLDRLDDLAESRFFP